MSRIRSFNFIRNSISHSDGFCSDSKKGFEEAAKFISTRTNEVSITKLKAEKDNLTHRIQILQSSLLIAYIDLIKDVFNSLIKTAKNTPIVVSEK